MTLRRLPEMAEGTAPLGSSALHAESLHPSAYGLRFRFQHQGFTVLCSFNFTFFHLHPTFVLPSFDLPFPISFLPPYTYLWSTFV